MTENIADKVAAEVVRTAYARQNADLLVYVKISPISPAVTPDTPTAAKMPT